MRAESRSYLPELLTRAGELPVAHAVEGEPVRTGRIYVAPPDRHMVLLGNRVHLTMGPRENGVRPAADPLFRSAARTFGRRVMGVVLSGSLDDGSAGMLDISRLGGLTVAQKPEEAFAPDMPKNAIARDHVDKVLPLAEIARLMVTSAKSGRRPPPPKKAPNRVDRELESAMLDPAELSRTARIGKPSLFSCPECGGVLWETEDGDLLRYRCRVGHAFSADALVASQNPQVEAALFAALRALEESATLTDRLAKRAERRHHARTAAQFRARAQNAEEQAAIVRSALLRTKSMRPAVPAPRPKKKARNKRP